MRTNLIPLETSHSSDFDGNAARDRLTVILIAILGIGWQIACASLTALIYYWLRKSSPDLAPSAFSLSVFVSSALAWVGALISCSILLRRGGWPVWWAVAAVTCQHIAIAITITSDLAASTAQHVGLMLVAAPCLLWGSSIRKGSKSAASSTMSCARTLLYALKTDGPLSPDDYDRCIAIIPLIVTVLLADVAYIAVGAASSVVATAGLATVAAATSIIIMDLASRRADRARLTGRAILSIGALIVTTVGICWIINLISMESQGMSAVNLIYACLGPGLLALLQVSGKAAKNR